MYKKLAGSCATIAVFAALLAASAASASPVLTDEGKTVPVGTAFIATSTETPMFTAIANNTCSKSVLTGTVTKNSGTRFEATVPIGKATYSGTGTGGDCTSSLGSTRVTVSGELCLVSEMADALSITGCEGKAVVLTLEVTGTGACKYSTAVVKATFTTNVTPATVRWTEQEIKLIEGGVFCPTSYKVDQNFDLYTDNHPTETPLTIS